jgi:hypothetical protein
MQNRGTPAAACDRRDGGSTHAEPETQQHRAESRSRARSALPARVARLTGVLLLAFLSTAAAQYAVRNGTVAGGGGTVASGQFRLTGTIGEPASGTVSTPQYRLTSGYPATIGDGQVRDGGIFQDSFED